MPGPATSSGEFPGREPRARALGAGAQSCPGEKRDVMSEKPTLRNFVNGEHVDTVEGRTVDLVDPSQPAY